MKSSHQRRRRAIAVTAAVVALAAPGVTQASAKPRPHAHKRWFHKHAWYHHHRGWRKQDGDQFTHNPWHSVVPTPPVVEAPPIPPPVVVPPVVTPPAEQPPAEEAPPVGEEPTPPVEEPSPPKEEPKEEEPAPPKEEEPAPPHEEPAPPKEEPKQEEPPPKEEPAPPKEEPAPPKEEPAPPAEGSQQIFVGDQIKDFDLLQAAPGAITEVPDPLAPQRTVMKMTVKNSDVFPVTPTGDPRAQLLSPEIFEAGDEYWWNSEFLLPSDYPASISGWNTVLEGPYGEPFNGTPPWHIEVNGSTIRWSRNGTYDWDIPWQEQLVRGQWVHVLVHGRFAVDGWVEMWIDGKQVTFFSQGTFNPNQEAATKRIKMKMIDSSNDEAANFAVIQNYRELGALQTGTVYQGPMRIGTTRESVGG
jgi:hypothetical protein